MISQDSIYYRGLTIDRAGELRKSASWINQQWQRQDCQILLVQNHQNLMLWQQPRQQAPVAIRHQKSQIHQHLDDPLRSIFLGIENDVPVFAYDLIEELSIDDIDPGKDFEFIDIRQAGWLLPADDAAILAMARGLVYWNRQTAYCSRCGSPADYQSGGHMRLCSNDDCGRMFFPRTDPAVIMLIEDVSNPDDPKCLLARNSRFPERMMSTLAGFVDPLESLEETVIRESFEETGIVVEQAVYVASQPWPFPSSIMLGFRAKALTTDINVDGVEIEEAAWFSARELAGFGEWGDGGNSYCLPRQDSIARYLVESWKHEVLNR